MWLCRTMRDTCETDRWIYTVMLCKYWFTFRWHMRQFRFLLVHAHTYGNIKLRREDHFWAHTCNVWPIESAYDLLCALAGYNALRTFVIKITPQKKEKKVVSESFHRFFNSLNEWRISRFSVYGARALDEVRFIPLSCPRSHHQWNNWYKI